MKKYKYEEVKEYIESFGYTLISEKYESNSQILEMICPHRHKWKSSFGNFKNKHRRCSLCYGNKKKTKLEIEKELEHINYKLLSDYKNANTKIIVLCDNGHEWETTWGKIQSGRRCPYCSGKFNNASTLKDMVESENGYHIMSIENNLLSGRLTIRCNEGHEYSVTANNFKQGRRCPYCSKSKGEKEIMRILDEYNINYIYDNQYFKDLKGFNGGILRPDFIIENNKIWIEYDGEFHYEDLLGYLQIQQFNDELKNEYAKEHEWKLIRIPYWEFDNIENILVNELKLYK